MLGLITGFQTPIFASIAFLVGNMMGRYVFQRIFGAEWWMRYRPVVLAGIACGYGVIIAITASSILISKALWHTQAAY